MPRFSIQKRLAGDLDFHLLGSLRLPVHPGTDFIEDETAGFAVFRCIWLERGFHSG